jgi:hypothetical protein
MNINNADLDLLRLYCGPYFYSTILVLYEQKKDLFSLIYTNILFHKWLLIPPVTQNPCFCDFCFTPFIILACVVDLDSLNPDPDPAFKVNPDPDSRSRVLMTKH